MTSNHFYHKQPNTRPNRRDRVLVIDAANKPEGPVTNPDSIRDNYVSRHVKVFIIILMVMIGFMVFSIKLVEYLWVRRDRSILSTPRTLPVRDTPAVLSTDTPSVTPTRITPTPPAPAPVSDTPQVKRNSSSGVETIFRWGKVLEDAGELEGALDRYQEALNVDPNNVMVLTQAGRLNIRMARYDAAIDLLKTAREQSKENPDILNDLGVAFTFNGQEAEAVELYDELISLHPDYVPALFNQGYALVQLQDYDQARPKLESYLVKRPDDAMALGVLAVLEIAEKNQDQALELLDRAIKASPEWIMPYLDAATICATTEKYERSLAYLEKALEIGNPAEVYKRYQSSPFSPIRSMPEGRTFELKIAESARKTIK